MTSWDVGGRCNLVSQSFFFFSYLIGFNVETIEHRNMNFVTWDVSGRCGIVRFSILEDIISPTVQTN